MTACSASMDDCFTNIFQITELVGLKWKRLTTPEDYVYPPDIDQDPIINAFYECVLNNIFATWRKRQPAPPPCSLDLDGMDKKVDPVLENILLKVDYPKELFVFWYTNDEPEVIQKLLKDGLIAPDEMDTSDQIKYETRILFYNALHHVFEQNCFKNGLSRFGKWFVMLLEDHPDRALPAYVNAFCLNYLCFGESVCCELKVQRQDPILRLSKRMLNLNRRMAVILGPRSVRATLLPDQPFYNYGNGEKRDYSNVEELQQKLNQEAEFWKKAYSLPQNDNEDEPMDGSSKSSTKDNSEIPKFLLIEIEGVQLFFPAYLIGVLATELETVQHCSTADTTSIIDDDNLGLKEESLLAQLDRTKRKKAVSQKMEAYIPETLRHHRRSYVGVRIGSKNFEDASFPCPPRPNRQNQPSMHLQTTEDIRWNVIDYIPKTMCVVCPMCTGTGNNEVPPGPSINYREKCVFHHNKKQRTVSEAEALNTRSANYRKILPEDPELSSLIDSILDMDHHSSGRETPGFARTVNSASRRIPDRLELDSPVTDIAQHFEQSMNNLFSSNLEDHPNSKMVRPFSPLTQPTHPYHYPEHGMKSIGPPLADSSLYMSQNTTMTDSPAVHSFSPSVRRKPRKDSKAWLKEIGSCLSEQKYPDTNLQVSRIPQELNDEVSEINKSSSAPYLREGRSGRGRTSSLSPVRNYDPHNVSVILNTEESFVSYKGVESVINEEDSKPDSNPREVTEDLSTFDDYDELSRTVQEDTADIEDPKTPGSSFNCGTESQLFSSVSINSDQILSPPASNERVEFNNTQSSQTNLQQQVNVLPSQTLITSQNAKNPDSVLNLHEKGWNTANVTVNNVGDNLNAIYPTPPTPIQQFSPLNATDEIIAKKLRSDYDDENSQEVVFNDYRLKKNNFTMTLDDFLPQKVKNLPVPEDLSINLLDKNIDLKYRTKSDKSDLRKVLKKTLQKRDSRTAIMMQMSYLDLPKECINTGKTLFGTPFPLEAIQRLTKNPTKMAKYSLNMREKPRLFKSFGFGILKSMANYKKNLNQRRLQPQPQRPSNMNNNMNSMQPNMMTRPQQLMMQQQYGQQHNSPMMRQQQFMPPHSQQQHQQQMHMQQQMQMHGMNPQMPMSQQQMSQQQQYMMMRQQQMQRVHQANSFSAGSPANSLYSNPQSVQQPPIDAMMNPPTNGTVPQLSAPSPFGSPVNQMIGSVGQTLAHRTPGSMAPLSVSYHPDSIQKVPSVISTNDQNLSVQPRSVIDAPRMEDLLALLQNNKMRAIMVSMQDTIFDLFFDGVFDACPICSCNANIRSSAWGMYIQLPMGIRETDEIFKRQQEDPTYKPYFWSGQTKSSRSQSCLCGFSAIRYRILSWNSQAMFYDDIKEASHTPKLRLASNRALNNPKIIDMVTTVRFLCWTNYLSRLNLCSYYLGDIPDRLERNITINAPDANYIVSKVEGEEFDVAVRSLLGAETNHKSPLFQPWGLQVAQAVKEPKDSEYMAVLREVLPVLEQSIKQIRGSEFTGRGNIVEGPLTWRQFYKKASKTQNNQEEESFKAEVIPNVLVTADRDPVSTNPQLIHMWEKLTMAPYDQPKDVLYLAVAPEGNVFQEKVKFFMEELSNVYEKCRFGRHVKVNIKDPNSQIKDGILKVNCTRNFISNDKAFPQLSTEEEKRYITKTLAYHDGCMNTIRNFFATNDNLFERRTYFETLHRDSLKTHVTALASSLDSMPPPPNPTPGVSQSPSSVLSTQSGPSSHGQAMVQPVNTPPGMNLLQQSPNVNLSGNPMSNDAMSESIRTPENPVGTPGNQPAPSDESNIERTVDELMSEEIPHALPHVIVLYIITPCALGTSSTRPFKPGGTLNMLKTLETAMKSIRPERRPQLQIEIINAQQILDYNGYISSVLREETQILEPVEVINREKSSAHDNLRRLAFSVYNQTRILVPENVRGVMCKSMTRFGPSAQMSDILDNLRNGQELYFKVPCQPYILAPRHQIGMANSAQKFMLLNPDERVLFVSYCLFSEDFLLATVTDQHGHLHDNVFINLNSKTEHGYRLKNRSQINDAIQRLWLFIQSVLVMGTKNWRLVISKVGKIGHGEFLAWSNVLSRKNLKAFNNNLRNKGEKEGGVGGSCKTCNITVNMQELPVILSACLVSVEAEPNLRLFPGFSATQETKPRGGSKKDSSPPNLLEDTSITHIVTFPTSPIIDLATNPAEEGDDFDFMAGEYEEPDDGLGVNDLTDLIDEANIKQEPTIDNQPLAVGYMVSTAPAAELPDWFWNGCPNVKRHLPVHLRNALHINLSNLLVDDELSGVHTDTFHPLDENQLTDVILKYIMQMHNALSWLNVDIASGARHSCLPVHQQALFRLYHNIDKLF